MNELTEILSSSKNIIIDKNFLVNQLYDELVNTAQPNMVKCVLYIDKIKEILEKKNISHGMLTQSRETLFYLILQLTDLETQEKYYSPRAHIIVSQGLTNMYPEMMINLLKIFQQKRKSSSAKHSTWIYEKSCKFVENYIKNNSLFNIFDSDKKITIERFVLWEFFEFILQDSKLSKVLDIAQFDDDVKAYLQIVRKSIFFKKWTEKNKFIKSDYYEPDYTYLDDKIDEYMIWINEWHEKYLNYIKRSYDG